MEQNLNYYKNLYKKTTSDFSRKIIADRVRKLQQRGELEIDTKKIPKNELQKKYPDYDFTLADLIEIFAGAKFFLC